MPEARPQIYITQRIHLYKCRYQLHNDRFVLPTDVIRWSCCHPPNSFTRISYKIKETKIRLLLKFIKLFILVINLNACYVHIKNKFDGKRKLRLCFACFINGIVDICALFSSITMYSKISNNWRVLWTLQPKVTYLVCFVLFITACWLCSNLGRKLMSITRHLFCLPTVHYATDGASSFCKADCCLRTYMLLYQHERKICTVTVYH